MKSVIKGWIRTRLNGYQEVVNHVDSSKPLRGTEPRTVAVVGGGLAGIAAASLLGERGFRVTLFDKNSYLGGKVGSWPVQFADGFEAQIDHGFHAFFRHYYNLSRFLEKLGSDRYLERIDDYLILGKEGVQFGFSDVETTPVLNILSLGKQGFFSFREVMFKRQIAQLRALLQYDRDRTFADWDHTSYDEFAARTHLPPGLKLVFGTFARAFFTPGDKLSMAELIKSFHFFYLSNDCGLLYDYFTRHYQRALLDPVLARFKEYGVRVELGRPVEAFVRRNGVFIMNEDEYDYVILAADVTGVKHIAERALWIQASAPDLHRQLTRLQASLGYAVFRLWLDRCVQQRFPVFVITEKRQVLDSVTFYHQFDREARKWAEETRGGVYELHCYALPPALSTEAEVRDAFLNELHDYLPELRDARVLYENLQLRRDFTAFHCNLDSDRPATVTSIDNLYLAGDWVKLPVPAMLMEGAFTSGLLSANAILTSNGLREEAVLSVPRKGIFA